MAGVGRPKYFGREYVSSDMTVIDVGINFTEEGMCGDMDFDEVRDIVSAITPVPGGIGTVTSAILLRHLVESAELSIRADFSSADIGIIIDDSRRAGVIPWR